MRSSAALVLSTLAAAFSLSCGGGGGGDGGGDPNAVGLRTVASGFAFPLYVTSAPADASRLYVVEKGGAVRIVDGGTVTGTFLDVSGLVSSGSEQGLLGLAFHPSFPADPRVFVNYTDAAGDTRVVAYQATRDAANPATATVVLAVDQPAGNHNGGHLAFGADGFLYIGLGDGGGANDPSGNGQNLGVLLGKMLRIDVNGGSPYAIPGGNPFAGTPGARGEIWDLGLRNPFRYSFDRSSGALFIADVGQGEREEVDIEPAGGGGRNYGWAITEGTTCLGGGSCDKSGLTDPAYEYGHDEGCSITGGYVYRGSTVTALQGRYVFGDFCSGFVRSVRTDGSDPVDHPNLSSGGMITSFGEDANGEIYVVTSDGVVSQIVGS